MLPLQTLTSIDSGLQEPYPSSGLQDFQVSKYPCSEDVQDVSVDANARTVCRNIRQRVHPPTDDVAEGWRCVVAGAVYHHAPHAAAMARRVRTNSRNNRTNDKPCAATCRLPQAHEWWRQQWRQRDGRALSFCRWVFISLFSPARPLGSSLPRFPF